MPKASPHLVNILDAPEGKVDLGVKLVVLVALAAGLVGHGIDSRPGVDHVDDGRVCSVGSPGSQLHLGTAIPIQGKYNDSHFDFDQSFLDFEIICNKPSQSGGLFCSLFLKATGLNHSLSTWSNRPLKPLPTSRVAKAIRTTSFTHILSMPLKEKLIVRKTCRSRSPCRQPCWPWR